MTAIPMSAARVYVIAPAMLSWVLERLLHTRHPYIEVTGAACSAAAALADMQGRPACLVLIAADCDADLAQLAQVRDGLPGTRHLVITGSRDTTLMDRAVLAGAHGVVRNFEPPETLLDAVQMVNEGGLWIDRGTVGRMDPARHTALERRDPEKSKIATLTQRERQTIAAMTGDCGVPAKVIASRLCISENTLRNHLTSIYSKLDVCSRLDLYAYARRHQLTNVG
jgi:two-component system nitrate/nitrite response regulator NarL